MESSRILMGMILVGLFNVISSGEVSQEISSDDTLLSQQEPEKDLIEAMEALFGKYNNDPSTEKRGIPQCAVGSRCAMKLGPRIGKLCECGRGSNCNSFLLKCL